MNDTLKGTPFGLFIGQSDGQWPAYLAGDISDSIFFDDTVRVIDEYRQSSPQTQLIRQLRVMDDPQTKARFAALLRGSQSRLLGYIHSLVRDVNDADDLFQQTAVILWNKFDSYDPSRNFTAWACGVARLEVSNFIRSRSRKKLYLSDDLNLLLIDTYAEMARPEVEDDERKEALSHCVAKLRERDRDLLLTCYTGEEDIVRIADRMGRSSQSVHNSLRRIREALYECIQRTIAQEAHA